MALRGTRGTPELDPVAPLLRVYRAKLFDISQRLRAGDLLPDSYLAGQIDPILKALKSLDAEAYKWARKMVNETYPLGLKQARQSLKGAGFGIDAGFGDFDRRASQALIARTSANLANIRETLVEGLLGGENPTQRTAIARMREALAGDNALVEVAGRGLKVSTPSGRMWDPEKYARMLGRTATNDARLVAKRARYLENGVDIVRIIANGSTHSTCIAWEGVSVSLTGRTPGYPTVADARSAGLWHPYCKHTYVVDTEAEQPRVNLTSPDVDPYSTLGQYAQPQAQARRRAKAAGTTASAIAKAVSYARYVPKRKIAEAAAWAKERRTFQMAGRKMKLTEWNAVNAEVAKLPEKAQALLASNGGTIELVVGKGVPEHPTHAHLKGKKPRGWSEGSTWDDVPGAGPTVRDAPTVVVANMLKKGHGSQNLILHEVAHGLDIRTLSVAEDWQDIWKREQWWDSYTADYAEEAFAESFAYYFDGVESRARLPESVRRYLSERFE